MLGTAQDPVPFIDKNLVHVEGKNKELEINIYG
jgi:hypothetical protein